MRRRTCISFFVLSVLSAALCISSCDRMELMPQRPQSDEGKSSHPARDCARTCRRGSHDPCRRRRFRQDPRSEHRRRRWRKRRFRTVRGLLCRRIAERRSGRRDGRGKDITIHFSEEFTGRYGLTRKILYRRQLRPKDRQGCGDTVGLLKVSETGIIEGFPAFLSMVV